MGSIAVDYPLWSWDGSNGNATTEQTVAAYEAVSNQGLCIDFSHLVWDDIVDTLNELLNALGMTWDSTYARIDDTKISVAKGQLMGQAFNSVRHNIQRVAFTTWKWQFDYTLDGYVGRNDFRGVSLWGTINSDRVYGWYIIELVRKLNVAIELMRGTWPVAELLYGESSNTRLAVNMPVLPAIKLPITLESQSKLELNFKVDPIVKILSATKSNSHLITDFFARQIVPVQIETEAQTFVRERFKATPAKVLKPTAHTSSQSVVCLKPLCAPKFTHNDTINTETQIEFVVSPWVVKLPIVETARTDIQADMRSGLSLSSKICQTSVGTSKVDLTAKDVQMLNAIAQSASNPAVKLHYSSPLAVASVNIAENKVISELVQLNPSILDSVFTSFSKTENTLILRNPLPIITQQKSASYHTASIYSLASDPVCAVIRAISGGRGRIIASDVRHLGTQSLGVSEAQSTVETINPTHIYAIVSGKTEVVSNVAIDQPNPLNVTERSKCLEAVHVIAAIPQPLQVAETAVSSEKVQVDRLPPTPMPIAESSESNEIATIAQGIPQPVQAVDAGRSASVATVVSRNVSPVKAVSKSDSNSTAKLGQITLEPAIARVTTTTQDVVLLGSAWDPPIWVDGGLWFRQLYDAVQTDDVLEVI